MLHNAGENAHLASLANPQREENMKKILIASVAAMGLSLVACDSAAENEVEDDIEQMEDTRDTQVDAMEESGEITEDQADVMDDNTDAMEESMEEEADEMPNEM